MDGFQKINLDVPVERKPDPSPAAKPATQTPAMPRRRKNTARKNMMVVAAVIIALILFSAVGVVLPATKTAKQAKFAYDQTRLALAELKKQDINAASDQIATAQKELAKTVDDLHSFAYLQFVPLVNFYYSDASHLLNAGTYGLQGVKILVDAIKPYADVLGLKGQGSFVLGSAQDRITTAVRTMDKITPKIDDIEKYLVLASKELDQVNPDHYLAIFGGQKIRDQLTQAKTLADEGVTFITDAKPLVKILPSVLGEPNEKKYLLIFQNDKELRPSGGFMTGYAIFRLDHGVIKVDRSDDIYNLDATIPYHPVAPRPILQYLPKVPTLNLRDTNLSPDFVLSMEEFNKLYQKAGGYQKVDGIIAVDTHALVAAMNILGNITTDGITFTPKTDPRCNCPQVIYQLEATADTPTNHIVANRKGIVGDLMYAIIQKAFSSSPKLYWGQLFQTMITETNQKHILFDIYNADAQKGIEALNAAGRINQNFQGDYLHINEANLGGEKSNLFTSEKVDQKYEVASDGTITKTVTINYKNPYPPSDCNLEHGNLCLNAVLRNWFRIYVPKGSIMRDSSGSEVKMISYDELGKTVFEGFLTVRPLGATTFTISYTLPFKVGSSTMPLLIQKQPGTDNPEYTIHIGSTQVQDFPLLTDKTLELNVH